MFDSAPVTTYQWAFTLIEDHIQDCRVTGLKIDEVQLRGLLPQLIQRLEDFLCVLKSGKTLADLRVMGDAGLIEEVRIFGASALTLDGPVLRRYNDAIQDRDRKFLNRINDALKRQRDIDRRITRDRFLVKSFLFLNWDIPFFIDYPLSLLTNPQIFELLEKFFLHHPAAFPYKAPEVWDEQRIKKEIHALGLRRRPIPNLHSKTPK